MKRLMIIIISLLAITGCNDTKMKEAHSQVVDMTYMNEELKNKLDSIVARCDQLEEENKKYMEEAKYSENNLRNLEEELVQNEEEITNLKEEISEIKEDKFAQAQKSEISEEDYDRLLESRFAAYSRLIFQYPENDYDILTVHDIKNDWYIVNQESFKLKLNGYENADSVEFYLQKLESEINPTLLYIDDTQEDGWTYSIDKVESVIEKNTKSNIPRYVIYTEVTLDNGMRVKTSLLPIYNAAD